MSSLGAVWSVLEVAAETGREKIRGPWGKRIAVVAAVLLLGSTMTSLFLSPDPTLVGAEHSPDSTDVCAGADDTEYYDIAAIELDIVYNDWGDHDPDGRLFVVEENKDELRQQVQENPDEPADLAQPLAIRAHVGDCVVMNLTNELPNPASLHVHGVEAPAGQGSDVGDNGQDLTAPNATRSYKVYIPDDPAMEGGHFLHSHASERFQTRHGLFGALVAEPKGTDWLAPNGSEMESGTAAMIVDPNGPDHREFVILYHDEIKLQNENGSQLPEVSPYGEYGPGSKGINLRSEPFMKRFDFHGELNDAGEVPLALDKSQGYGSYTYGDPATFFMESYVGDPAKHRLMNAGPGQHHVHHLHGGGIRWKHSPVSDDTQIDEGLTKENPINRSDSERKDVQSLGPGESFNAEIEGGSGGVQQSVGDFLIHCHVVEHYIAGMWMFWRVYNTEQDGLAELPGRDPGFVQDSLNSTELFQKYQNEGELPDGSAPTEDNFRGWVEDQLPAQGVAGPDDASVWDWQTEDTADGPLYLGEPETHIEFANYPADAEGRLADGERPELAFDPTNGRLAFPMLRPQPGERPPFAPGHGGAPYLGDDVTDDRPDGLCPKSAGERDYDVVATNATVRYNEDDVDTNGQIYTLAKHLDETLSEDRPAKSLVLRANQGECNDVTLTSRMHEDGHTKVNMHIHLVQFDVQASDGVITGFNYEQSVRPAPAEAEEASGNDTMPTVTRVTSQSTIGGETVLGVERLAPFLDANDEEKIGSHVGIGLTEETLEQASVVDVDASSGTITVDAALDDDHVGEYVGYEIVNYRWYPDVELGMVYWHDHVDGLKTWKHGLFGGLVVEPADSQWCDPKREANAQTTCGDRPTDHVVDVVDEADPSNETDTYREYVVQAQDRSEPDDLASFNLRGQMINDRENTKNPLNSSDKHGAPSTDLWEAYPGDEVQLRLLYAGQSTSRAVGTFGVTGHRMSEEPFNDGSLKKSAIPFGISSQFNPRLECGAGSCQDQAGDYMYYMTEPDHFERGAWGIFRVHEPGTSSLVELPNNENPTEGQIPSGPPDRTFDLVAMQSTVAINERMFQSDDVSMFVPADRVDEVDNDPTAGEPLVLRAQEGDLIEVNLTNDLGNPVTIHPGYLAADPETDAGVPIGDNPLENVQVQDGTSRTFTWYADEPGVAYLTSYGVPGEDGQAMDGMYGAIVVEPADTSFDDEIGPTTNLTLPDGTTAREHVLLYGTAAPKFQASIMPYDHQPDEFGLVNYRAERWDDRLDDGISEDEPTNPHVYNTSRFGEPETPTIEVGQNHDRLRIIAVKGAGNQLQVHHAAGHYWKKDPQMNGSQKVSFATLGQRGISDAWIEDPRAGGPGQYLYGDSRVPFTEIGAWGLIDVT